MSKKELSLGADFTKGLWDQNPVLRQLLGMCPTLAVTTSAINGLGMGVATTFVLVCASLMVSLVRKAIPAQVRIASYIVIIAAFVTIVDLAMKAKFPALSKSLGAFIPLIVVNCVILGRQEAYASKNNPLRSVVDAAGMGLGFTASLIVLGGVRELLGNRTVFGFQLLPDVWEPWIVMILPAGAFLTLGLILGGVNMLNRHREQAALQTARRASLAVKEA
ncbi:MAG: electron transport complex subunit E [Candidatus Krumholzibacteriia bacterium]